MTSSAQINLGGNETAARRINRLRRSPGARYHRTSPGETRSAFTIAETMSDPKLARSQIMGGLICYALAIAHH